MLGKNKVSPGPAVNSGNLKAPDPQKVKVSFPALIAPLLANARLAQLAKPPPSPSITQEANRQVSSLPPSAPSRQSATAPQVRRSGAVTRQSVVPRLSEDPKENPCRACCRIAIAAKVLACLNLFYLVHSVSVQFFQFLEFPHVLKNKTRTFIHFYPLPYPLIVTMFSLQILADDDSDEQYKFERNLECLQPTLYTQIPSFVVGLTSLTLNVLFLFTLFECPPLKLKLKLRIMFGLLYMQISFYCPDFFLTILHIILIGCTSQWPTWTYWFVSLVGLAIWAFFNGAVTRGYVHAVQRTYNLPVEDELDIGGDADEEVAKPNRKTMRSVSSEVKRNTSLPTIKTGLAIL